ncbi:MAG: cytochrome d ubiquinol oxidase subunit II [Desulfobulbales bacterium]
MAFIESNLPDIWLLLIGFFLLYYAITDGANLGIGVLSLLERNAAKRGTMMSSIGHTWHASQTWLVILGGMLFGAFPIFYSVFLSALYIPVIIMLIGLIFRGVSFEFYERAQSKTFWLNLLGCGSLIVCLAQGFALGGLLGGLDVLDNHYTGTPLSWLTPYSVLVAGGLLCGYLMLGANYMIARTTGSLQVKGYRLAWLTGLLTLVLTSGVHIWTFLYYPDITARRHGADWFFLLLIGMAGIAFIMFFRSLAKRQQIAPYFWNSSIIILSFTALSIDLYPHMIPGVRTPGMTVQEAAASPLTLKFMLVVTIILLPVILTYTSYNYWIFRGKTYDDRNGQNE